MPTRNFTQLYTNKETNYIFILFMQLYTTDHHYKALRPFCDINDKVLVRC